VTVAPALLVDIRDPTPPYEQLRRQLAGLVGSGVLTPGDRLPPVRQVAADLGLAVGTVARAYRELEAAGLVRTRRGGGTRVRELDRPEAETRRTRQLREDAEALVSRARRAGATDDEVRAAVTAALDRPR
jgi:DNA-binding transcriptional regulator YhcF (GntR family)